LKRFTDTEIWKRPWFRKLTPAEKCAFQYIKDNCDNAGVWIPDYEAAEFYIGESVDWESLLQQVNKNIQVLDSGKWWVPDFCEFQWGELREGTDNKAQRSYITLLKRHRLWPLEGPKEAPTRGHTTGPLGSQEKEKEKEKDLEKDKDKDKDKEKEKDGSSVPVRWPSESLEIATWFAFEKSYGGIMPDRERNRSAVDQIVHLARERGDPEVIIPKMMEKLLELKETDNGRKGFWKRQPFLPSTLVSLWARVWEEAKIEAQDQAEAEEIDPVEF